ncbi:ribosome production factor 2 homolog [Schistocerca serialis cubense]|uniref:ribosome production factor 2 homolog n=1 Tax=Schistocerca cancellata TaxID=274614 RepID=UPI0021192345|nr:ribosome production factor 2 homolog [Schistocerca cancellata]XP_049938422.1 ribosome production factor 2 homolog [Schistocerca serialis cubense]
MGVIQRIKKAKTHRGKKILQSRESKLIEDPKETLFLQGRKTSQTVLTCMKDLYAMKKPQAVMLSKKHDILPFENIVPVEDFARKYNTNLFVFGSHNKKRPNNLVLGRMYDHHLLDMVELGIDSFKSIHDFKTVKPMLGIKPCILFVGELFEHNYEFRRIKNLLVDLFHRENVEAIRLQGLEHVIMFTAVEDKLYFRSYRILLKKSGTRIPRVEVEEVGPSVDFKLRRVKLASDDLFKLSCKKPKELKVKKVKNISEDAFGTQHGRIHVPKQNIGKLQTRKMKGLKKTFAQKKSEKQLYGKRKSDEYESNEDVNKKLKVE